MIKLFQTVKQLFTYRQRNQAFIQNAKLLQPQHDYIFPWLYKQ